MINKRTTVKTFYTTGEVVKTIRINDKRIGISFINRGALTMYLSFNDAIVEGSGDSMRLRPNESMEFLDSEGDDCTKEVYTLGTAGIAFEVIESIMR